MKPLKLGVLIAVMAFALAACDNDGGTDDGTDATTPPIAGSPAPALESPLGENGTDTLAETVPPIMSPAASAAASPA
jgi:hypothetical protein